APSHVARKDHSETVSPSGRMSKFSRRRVERRAFRGHATALGVGLPHARRATARRPQALVSDIGEPPRAEIGIEIESAPARPSKGGHTPHPPILPGATLPRKGKDARPTACTPGRKATRPKR